MISSAWHRRVVALLPDTLESGSVSLQRCRVAHLDAVLEAIHTSFVELERWLPFAATMPTVVAERAHLASAESAFSSDLDWSFTVFETGTSFVVGSAALHRRADTQHVEVGYWIRSDRTRRGYASSATSLLVHAAFSYLADLQRVEIRMDEANHASVAVPSKLGFAFDRHEARPKQASGHTGRGLVWVLTRDDWHRQVAATA